MNDLEHNILLPVLQMSLRSLFSSVNFQRWIFARTFSQTNTLHVNYVSCTSVQNQIYQEDESGIHTHNYTRHINPGLNTTIDFRTYYISSHTSSILYSQLFLFFSFWTWWKHCIPFRKSFLNAVCFSDYKSIQCQAFKEKVITEKQIKIQLASHTCTDCRVFTPKRNFIS